MLLHLLSLYFIHVSHMWFFSDHVICWLAIWHIVRALTKKGVGLKYSFKVNFPLIVALCHVYKLCCTIINVALWHAIWLNHFTAVYASGLTGSILYTTIYILCIVWYVWAFLKPSAPLWYIQSITKPSTPLYIMRHIWVFSQPSTYCISRDMFEPFYNHLHHCDTFNRSHNHLHHFISWDTFEAVHNHLHHCMQYVESFTQPSVYFISHDTFEASLQPSTLYMWRV
jgi:hypothetical protein